MDKKKFNCVEYFPKVLESSHEKIINSIYQNIENTTFSHKINGRWEIKSQTGKLLLFDSNIEHSVPENKSKENRISIAFNLFSLPLKISSVNRVYSSNKFYS